VFFSQIEYVCNACGAYSNKMAKVLQVILIIWAVWFGLRLLFRVVFPWMLSRYLQHLQKNMQARHGRQHGAPRPPGEVTIEQPQTNEKTFSPQDGEYVDYEDIKE